MQFVANIPYIKCYLKKEYLYDLEKGHGEFEECVLLSVKSMQGRALMFEAYLPQYGACYDKFPLSAFVCCYTMVLEPFGTIWSILGAMLGPTGSRQGQSNRRFSVFLALPQKQQQTCIFYMTYHKKENMGMFRNMKIMEQKQIHCTLTVVLMISVRLPS